MVRFHPIISKYKICWEKDRLRSMTLMPLVTSQIKFWNFDNALRKALHTKCDKENPRYYFRIIFLVTIGRISWHCFASHVRFILKFGTLVLTIRQHLLILHLHTHNYNNIMLLSGNKTFYSFFLFLWFDIIFETVLLEIYIQIRQGFYVQYLSR